MMGLRKRRSVLRGVLWLFTTFLVLQSSCAQEGFVSLQCCAPSNVTDPETKISWTSDIDLFPKKGSCENISISVANNLTHNQARIFGTSSGNKWCYNLTTTTGRDYLIRGTFLHNSSPRTIPEIYFDVSLGATTITRVNSLVESLEVEGVFRATNDHVNFCLVKKEGNPYLSKLELRPLKELDYLKSDSSKLLKVIRRVDAGNTQGLIRHPYDVNDRIWNLDAIQSENISNINTIVSLANATIPVQVLHTALTDSKRLMFYYDDLDEGINEYQIILYFLELNDSIRIGQRVFDIYVNGVKKHENFDILENDQNTNYREVVLNTSANGVLNVSLVKVLDGIEFGPICNAYEIYQKVDLVEGTLQQDVDAIVELREKLVAGNSVSTENGDQAIWETWFGDPCLPLPWDGLLCNSINNEYNSSVTVITTLDLSSKGIQGPFPSTITELTHLETLNLSFNYLTGTISPFPSSSVLISIDVSYNELKGPIPESLASLRHLSKLYFGCNPNFGYGLPSILLNQSDLMTDFGTCEMQEPSSSPKPIVIGSVAGGSFLLTVAVGVIFLCFYRQRVLSRRRLNAIENPMMKNAVFSIPSMEDLSFKSIFIQNFSLECIESATNKYKTLIGEGGFGSVYRGTLNDGEEVAVKVRSATSTQGTREFDNELNLLSAIRNENLVPLIGYCSESDQQILVYPFMSNGSLQDRLYGEASKRKTLDWATRLSIALGAARGLLYLHTFAERCVIHRDVKSSNILLDHSMTAKVSDFGFSKYAPQEGDSNVSLEVRGTAGYLDPEYYSTQHLSAKSDVFSFGVVLLEIISGREPLNIHRPRNEWSLVEWAKPFIRESRIEEIVDPNIKGGYHAEAMWRIVEVALTCIEPFSAYRPGMEDIVRELEDALIIENNASEYMKSIESFGGSNRFSFRERKIIIPPTSTTTELSPIISQPMPLPLPR